jgi:tetratricopeptide (TPR) repeat protein
VALSDTQIQALARDAMQRAASGDLVSAERMFTQLVDARPNSGQALHLLGQARLKLGRFADAREPLERAAKFLPRDAAPQVNLAGCLSVLGQHAEALAALEHATRLTPGDAAIAHNRGRALEALGRREEAERAYDEALSIDSRLLPSLGARAALMAARGDWLGALGDLDMALTVQPDNAPLLVRRGELLLEQGDWLRGLDDYEARLKLPGRWSPDSDVPRWQGGPLHGGKLLIYPEQDDIESDRAVRDTLMLARGVEATIQCGERLSGWLDGPTVRRGESLAGFAAAAALRSLPRLLDWGLQSLPPPQTVRPKPGEGERIGWFTSVEPPIAVAALERDPTALDRCSLVVGDDVPATHLAALMGIPTVLLLGRPADWLWGPTLGKSPWYTDLELIARDDGAGLAQLLERVTVTTKPKEVP